MIFQVYTRKCFEDMTFLLAWPKSMQALEEISKHPVFGKAMPKVRLSLQQILSPRRDDSSHRKR